MLDYEGKEISIELPEDVKLIMDTFENMRYEIYVVGGCVRDSLLGKEVNDWDMCTNADPEEIISVCVNAGFKYLPTGLKHGTVSIVLNKKTYELTTYRIEGEYSDGRHPDKVNFTNSLAKDLARRDFTINALAYNMKRNLVDYFNGLQDIQNHVIRCVGSAEERFREDNLRRLRAIRFSSQLGFEIEEATYRQLGVDVEGLRLLSVERIREEFGKILLSDNAAEGIRKLQRLNMLEYIVPELLKCVGFNQYNLHHDRDVFEHSIDVVDNCPKEIKLRLAALLHDIAKPDSFSKDENGKGHFLGHDSKGAEMAEGILKRLKYDKKTIESVCLIIKYHMNRNNETSVVAIKKFINLIGQDELGALFELQIADIKSFAKEYRNYNNILWLKEQCKRIIEEKQPLAIKDLAITGADLIAYGYTPGPILGEVLNYLLDRVIEEPELNTKEHLLDILLGSQGKAIY